MTKVWHAGQPDGKHNIDHLLFPTEKATVGDMADRYRWANISNAANVERASEEPFLQPSKSYISAMEAMVDERAKAKANYDKHVLDALVYYAIAGLPLYEVVKEKKGVPTVIAINGNRYVLDNRHPL